MIRDARWTEMVCRVETLRISVHVNARFLETVPRGADAQTEALVARERAELAIAERELAALEAA
jgi:hypothetical protein